MHLGEDLLALAADAHADVVAEILEVADHGAEVLVGFGVVDDHHHVEESVDDGLGDVEHVHVVLREVGADAGDDTDRILSDDSDDCLVHEVPLKADVRKYRLFHFTGYARGRGTASH